MWVVKNRKKFFILSITLVVFSLFSIFTWGLNLGIEFTGGSITEVAYTDERPDIGSLKESIASVVEGDVLVQATGESGYIVRTKELSQEDHTLLLGALTLNSKYEFVEERYSLVGPSIGQELRSKAWIAIITVLLAIILFVAFVFRKASGTVLSQVETQIRSWHYGVIAIVALGHDILIPAGIFAFLGSKFIDAQIDVLFVTALLAILGYSVNDTIVVFDRVRENLRRAQELKLKKSFEEIVGDSLKQTYARSVNTSFTTLLVLISLFFIGSVATQNFALVLAIGVVAGTYSSIFLATPLLVTIGSRLKNKK